MRCEELRPHLAGHVIDGTPLPEDAEAHLRECPECRAGLEGLGETWTALARLGARRGRGAGTGTPPALAAAIESVRRGASGAKGAALRRAAMAAGLLLLGGVGGWMAAGAGFPARPYPTGRGTADAEAVADGKAVSGRKAAAGEEAAAGQRATAGKGADGELYALLIRGGDAAGRERETAAEMRAWAGELARRGYLVAGEELASVPAAWVGPREVDGDPPELGGFIVVRAESAAEARALAEESPHLAQGGAVEVRAVVRRGDGGAGP